MPLNTRLYLTAFRHRSLSTVIHNGIVINNERLEFLGDAILDAVISDYLYQKYPAQDEGFLTRMRAGIVQRKTMNQVAFSLGLKEFILFDIKNSPKSERIYGNALEALIGAIYLDRSYKKVNQFIVKRYLKKVELNQDAKVDYDDKSLLYHLVQDKKWSIEFDTHEEIEEAEHSPHFLSCVLINGKFIAEGKAWTKKEAEQAASRKALDKLQT